MFLPQEPFELVVTGDPNAKVGLVAVDKAVFLLNKNRLTQAKVSNIKQDFNSIIYWEPRYLILLAKNIMYTLIQNFPLTDLGRC